MWIGEVVLMAPLWSSSSPPPALHTWLISGWLVLALRLNEHSNITISKILSSSG